jgi:hypothetical protein
MIEIKIQVQHKGLVNVETLAKLLKDYLDTMPSVNEEITEEDILNWITRERWSILPNKSFVSVFSFQFEPFADPTIIEEIFYGKSSYLKDISEIKLFDRTQNVTGVLKLYDSLQLNKGDKYRYQIYEIEMDLREISNYVITYHQRNQDLKKTFIEFAINFYKEGWKEAHAKQFFENEFYHISFGEYTKFEEPRQMADKDLTKLLYDSNSFEDFRNVLDNRRLSEERHRDFFSSVKEDMDAVEKMRNVIAHNRSIHSELEEDYKKSKDAIKQQVGTFWENEKQQLAKSLMADNNFNELWEKPAKRKVEEILEDIYWTISGETDGIAEGFAEINEEDYCKQFYSLEDLQIALELIAEEEAELYMPTDEAVKEQLKELFDSEKIVLECLEPYREQIEGLGWVLE